MKTNLLDTVPTSHFDQIIAKLPPRLKQNLLAPVFICLFLFLFIPTNYVEGDAPLYVAVSKYLWLFFCLAYGFVCLFYNVKIGKPATYTFLTMVGLSLLSVELWLIISHFAIVLCCSAGGGSLDPTKTAVVSSLSLLLLLAGLLINIYIYHRLKKRVIMGCYQKSGKGFWDNQGRKNTYLKVIGILAPVCMSFSTASILVSRFWRITWDESYIPIVAVVGPILIIVLFLPFAYANAITLIRIYYYRRFGAANTSYNKKRKRTHEN